MGVVNSPVGLVTGHPGTAAQSGPAGKAARTMGWQPGEPLTQPNPTQPPPNQEMQGALFTQWTPDKKHASLPPKHHTT